jgi:hypothetical protein
MPPFLIHSVLRAVLLLFVPAAASLGRPEHLHAAAQGAASHLGGKPEDARLPGTRGHGLHGR